MKKLLLCALLISTVSFGQNFDNIEIGKPTSEVVKALTKKGFKFAVKNNNTQLYTGRLSNNELVTVYITSTPKSSIVWRMIVETDTEKFNIAKLYYDSYADNFTSLFGKPSYNVKEFIDPYKDGDGKELEAFQNYKANWVANWDLLDFGQDLTIKISNNQGYFAFVRVFENLDATAKDRDEKE